MCLAMKCFAFIILLHPHRNSWKSVLFSCLFYRWRNWGLKKIRALPEVIEPAAVRARILTQLSARRGFMAERVPESMSKAKHDQDVRWWKRKRVSDRRDNSSRGEGTSRPQGEQGVSLPEECLGKGCGRILNSEHSKDPALIILLDTRCGKVIWNLKLLNPALTECPQHFR